MRSLLRTFAAAVLLLAASAFAEPGAASPRARVKSLHVVLLSTMLSEEHLGEWGFAALVEADGHRILFDTGARPDTVLRNAREMNIDLSTVTDVILSHNHDDHTGGLLTLRKELLQKNPKALSRAHVGKGIFWPRPGSSGERNTMVALKAQYEATGGTFVEHDAPVELFPGGWLTGPVPRIYPERNWTSRGKLQTPEGLAEDTLPEDQSLVLDTDQGLVLISGCGHAGIINTLEYARKVVRTAPVHAAIGGFHLFAADEKTLAWTAQKLRELSLGSLMGAHCTGLEAVYRLRELAKLDRRTCVVGAVGASFELGKGFDPLKLAR